jgi:hypothetical protein
MIKTKDLQWGNLATYVRERRERLGLTQAQVASSGGPGTATQTAIEHAAKTSYQSRILASLEDALGWARGSCRAILDGGEPTVKPAAPVSPVTAVPALAPRYIPDADLPQLAAELGISDENADIFVGLVRLMRRAERRTA